MKKLVGDVEVSEQHHVVLDDAARGTLEKHFELETVEHQEDEAMPQAKDMPPARVQIYNFMFELKQQHVFRGRADVKYFLDEIKWLGGVSGSWH